MRGLGKAEIADRVKAALESVKMGHLAERKPNALSGGQQQRVALARALVVRPRCLLLDEPLSNLDAKLRLEMRSEIRRVCKEFGLTTIYVTHDQKEALSVADRMAVLDGGKLLQLGSPLEVYQRPKSKFVAEFIGETNFLPGTVLRSSPGSALVKTALGELVGVVPEGESAAQGSAVTVSLRPECIHLERQPVEENGFAGTIGESVYYGESAQHTLLAGDEKAPVRLKVTEFNPRFLGGRGGSEVYAWADPDDVVVLSR
jgi:iron(III) transport system ATP-binding protein